MKTYLKNSVIYQVYTRNFTKEGTFSALKEKLDYIKNLKVDILRWHAKGRSERIWCSVAEFSDSASYDDMVTTTTKFKLTGTPIYYDNMADPRIPTPSPGVGA